MIRRVKPANDIMTNTTKNTPPKGFSTSVHALFQSPKFTIPEPEPLTAPAVPEVKLSSERIKTGTPAMDHLPDQLRLVRYNRPEESEVEELLPYRYPIYDELWDLSYLNNWKPESVSMREDVACWKAAQGSDKYIDANTRHMILTNLSFFGTAEQLIGDNALSGLSYYVTMPEVRNQLLRMGFEESIHSRTFAWIIKNLGLSTKEIYQAHKTNPVIEMKDRFMKDATQALNNRAIDMATKEGRRTFMEALLAQMIMEGVLFYGGFAMNLSLRERGLMPGIGQQYAYVMRDESLHLILMREMFNHFKDSEWKDLWTEEFKEFTRTKFREAVDIEEAYARYALCEDRGGVPGLRVDEFIMYSKYLTNRRLKFIDLAPIFPDVGNPFPWLEKVADLPKDENFFESHKTEYSDQSGESLFD